MHKINRLKLQVAAKAIQEILDRSGTTNDLAECNQDEFDIIESVFSEVIEMAGVAVTHYALHQVKKKLFLKYGYEYKEEVDTLKERLDDEEALEKEEI